MSRTIQTQEFNDLQFIEAAVTSNKGKCCKMAQELFRHYEFNNLELPKATITSTKRK